MQLVGDANWEWIVLRALERNLLTSDFSKLSSLLTCVSSKDLESFNCETCWQNKMLHESCDSSLREQTYQNIFFNPVNLLAARRLEIASQTYIFAASQALPGTKLC